MKEYKKGTATKATTGVDAWKDVQWTDMEDGKLIYILLNSNMIYIW